VLLKLNSHCSLSGTHGTLSENAPGNGTVNSSIFSERNVSQSPPQVASPSLSHVERRSSILASIDELPESSAEASALVSEDVSDDDSSQNNSGSTKTPSSVRNNLTPADMFSVFIAHLGPPMVRNVIPMLSEVLTALEITCIHTTRGAI
jgi:hypothetical protein